MEKDQEIRTARERPLQVRNRQRNGLTRARRKRFLDHLSANCNVRMAAEECGVSPTTLYTHRRADPGFAEQWRMALLTGYDRLEEALLRRAIATVEGVEAADPDTVLSGSLDVKTAIDLLNRHRATIEGRERGSGRGKDTRATQAETDAALVKKLEQLARRRARPA